MWFRLAALLGCGVAEAQARISSYEFSEWCAYYQIEPFGAHLQNQYIAGIQAAIYNVNRDPKRRSRPFSADEFLIRFVSPEDKPDPFAVLKAWALAQPDAVVIRKLKSANPDHGNP